MQSTAFRFRDGPTNEGVKGVAGVVGLVSAEKELLPAVVEGVTGSWISTSAYEESNMITSLS